ncbi:hypothetical protein [Streptomyces atratus]|uniref:hypothetical protein n=1 Tax=Streptomyces atratus TaxID=1893 RepID=UPI0033CC3879
MTENPEAEDEENTGAPDPARRAVLAQELLRALGARCPGSRTELRGSLACGTADAYSDIDIAWTVPDDRFDAAVAAAPEILAAVRPLESLRSDPDLQHSRKRRLLFAAFRGLPLFWRVDLEIGASSVAHRPDYDRDNPAARGDGWSRPASAPAHAVAARKAVLRGQTRIAQGLLERGFRRIDAPETVSATGPGDWAAVITRLAEAAAAREPGLRPLADRVMCLAAEELPQLLWRSLPAAVREQVDVLVVRGRNIQAVRVMRECGIEPTPGPHDCMDVLSARHTALADRMPPPPSHDVDTLVAAADALPEGRWPSRRSGTATPGAGSSC